MIKHSTIKAHFYYVLLFLSLFLTTNFSFAQGDPWDDESSVFDESELYLNSNSNSIYDNRTKSIFQDQPVVAGGYLGIGIASNAPANQDPRGIATVGVPCDPDGILCDYGSGCVTCVTINSEILYLIFAGLMYGVYKSRKIFAPINTAI